MLRSGAIEAPPATMQSAAMLRSGAIEAPPATMQSAAMRWGHLPLAEESGTIAPQLVLTAHGSKDPRSAANARAIAGRLARMRPGLDVRVAFCELNSPNLVDVLNRCRGAAVVTPLLLADAYHARVDIPAQIASCRVGHRVRQASVLGEDIRLVSALHERLTELGFRRSTTHWGGRARDRLIASRGQCAHLDGGVKAGGGDPVGRGDDRFHHPTGGFAGRCHRSVATPRCPSDGHRAMAARPWDTV